VISLQNTADIRLRTEGVSLGYDGRMISEDLSVDIPEGSFTAIIGPNGCGKSTLLRGLAGVLPARSGTVTLDGRPIGEFRPKELARELGLLPQSSAAPEGIRVADLVSRGRAPYQGIFHQWRPATQTI